MDAGIYIAVLYMPKDRLICIGKLGWLHFRQGIYFYVGSAQLNLSKRLEHHSKKKKVLRWHIDYLSTKAKMLGAITIAGPQELECQLARKFSGQFEVPVPGFGASDCRCKGHLFYAPQF